MAIWSIVKAVVIFAVTIIGYRVRQRALSKKVPNKGIRGNPTEVFDYKKTA